MKKALLPLSILFFIILAVFIYFNRFVTVNTIKINGFALDSKVLTPNLLNGVDSTSGEISYKKVTNEDILYKSGNNYYIGIDGQESKTSIDIEYPIISEDSASLMTLTDNGYLVDEKFSYSTIISNTIVTDQHIYNGNNFAQLDNASYYFIALQNGTYINLGLLTIEVEGEEHSIIANSFITLGENYIRYYSLKNESFIYGEIPFILGDSLIEIGDYSGTYREFLIKMKVNSEYKEDVDFIEDVDGNLKNVKVNITDKDKETGLDIHYAQEDYSSLWGGKVYIKPEVSIKNVTSSIYSFRGYLSIYDPILVITKYPTFTFKIEDRVFLRKTFNREGNILVEGLLPDTTYTVEASYVYYNEKGQKIQKIIYEDTITTLSIDGVEDLNFAYDSIATSVDNFEIQGMRFENNPDDEVLNGIKQIEVVYANIRSQISVQKIRNLLALNKVDFTSPSLLNSNTMYEGEIVVRDVANNILKVNNKNINFTTKKSLPKSSITVEAGKNFTTASLYFSINNTDNVNVLKYFYVFYDVDGKELTRDTITENTKKREIENLDSGKKYYIILYCNYIDEEGVVQNNAKLATAEFISYDVARLGKIYLDIKYGDVTDNSQNVDIAYKNTDEIFIILYDMLDDQVLVKIYNNETGDLKYVRRYAKNNFRGTGSTLILDELASNTNYRIEFEFTITSGQNTVPINVDYGNKNNFKTLKLNPSFYVENLFVANGYIDFDAIIYDKDSSIVFTEDEERVTTLEVYASDQSRVYTQSLLISTGELSTENPAIINRITIDNLERGQSYTFKVIAKDYNNGLVSSSNYEISRTRKYILSGTSGSINLDKMIKTSYYDIFRGSAEGKNMFDIGNRARWKTSGESGSVGSLQIDTDNNVINIFAQNGYRQYNYYFPEAYQSGEIPAITVSFDVRRVAGTSTDFCLINGTGTSCTTSNATKITNVTDEYQHLDITINNVASSGYITFFIGETKNQNKKTSFDIKNLQIVVGEEANSLYKSFENPGEYVGLFDIELDELPTSELQGRQILFDINDSYDLMNSGNYDVFVRIECFGEKCPSSSNGFIVENKLSVLDLPYLESEEVDGILSDTNYIAYLSVYDSTEGVERYYDISKVSFASDAEIRTISNASEFFGMHTNGYYIAIDDIDLRNNSSTYSGTFQGKIDFQGHKLLIDNKTQYKIATLGGSGVFENVDVHYYLSEDMKISDFFGLFNTLNGRLSNVKMTLETSVDVEFTWFSLVCQWNFGIVENFVIHTKAPLIGKDKMALGPYTNYGIIRNGYVYGENIRAIYSANTEENNNTDKNVGVFAVSSTSGSVIKNVYSLIDIIVNDNPTNRDYIVGSVAASVKNASVRNVITFNIEDNPTRLSSKDNMFYSVSGLISNNLAYVSSNKYSDAYSKQVMAKTINDPLYLDNMINEDGVFDTANAFKYKIFPHVIWPNTMPTQDYLIIPTQETDKPLSLISVDEITYLDDDPEYLAKVLLTIHNKSLVKITGLQIDGIDKIDIVDQALNRNGKITLLYAMIGYPNVYKSSYTLNKIKSNVVDVTSNESINMNLYYPVNNLQEIHDLINVHENFRLNRDIDCLQEECPTTTINKLKGRINGQNHTIKNFTTNGCYINELNGSLENINFVNYKVDGKPNNSALICTASGAIIDGVLMVNEELTIGYSSNNNKNIKAAGIVAIANNSLIQNSGVNGLKMVDSQIGGSEIYFGGIAATSEYLSVENCFVRQLNFGIRKEIDGSSQGNTSANSNISRGIGGMVGLLTYGNVSNSYTTGKIDTDMGTVGGIAGINQNGYLDSVIAFVKIVASQDEIGGVIGRTVSNTSPKRDSSITKSLAMGAISTLLENPSYFGRTSGTSITINGNFAWDKQAINSRTSNNSDGETLLSTEDLFNSIIFLSKIGFSANNFALTDNFVPGYLPYVLNKNGEVLKGQGYGTDENVSDRRVYYEEALTLISADFKYEYEEGMETSPNKMYYATHAKATLRLNNPNYYQIKSLTIPGMAVQNMVAITNSEGITTLTFDAIPQRYYDSYNISKLTYMNGTTEEAIFPSIIIDLCFYGKINSAADWNRLMRGSLENYFIDHDIDFENRVDCNYSITFNNFVGLLDNGNKPKIKNIGTEASPRVFSSAGDALIDTIAANILNISFENIYIKNNSSSGNYSGIIKFLNGIGNNISFRNITINAPKNSYVGMISYNQSPDFRDIEMENVTVKGISFVGGLIGRSLARDVTNVNAYTINITATGDYVGGLIGYEAWDSSRVHTYQINIYDSNITVTANRTYTGGVFGYGDGNQIKFSNGYVEGYNRVGGISGQDGNPSSQYNYVLNSDIVGRGSYIGGATGINTTRYYTYVKNSNIRCKTDVCSTNYVGGISGGDSWYTILYSGVSDSTVKGGRAVGGIKGRVYYTYLYGNYVKDTTVTGVNYVGGIGGETVGRYNFMYLNTTNATVIATNTGAGGILGYGHNLYASTTEDRVYVYRNIVANSNVTAGNHAGGLIGKVDKELFTGQAQNYSNVISANVSCNVNDNCLAGYVIGTNDEYATAITNLRIYENSTLKIGSNSSVTLKKSNTVPDYFKSTSVMIGRDALATFKTYTSLSFSTSYYEGVTNKFPRLKVSVAGYRVDFDLPPVNQESSSNRASGFYVMPEVNVYAVDIDKINVEFSFIDEATSFVINEKTYTVNKKTFTFYYDFLEDFTIEISNGISKKIVNVSHEDLKNRVMIDGDSYYILDENGNIVSNNSIDYNKSSESEESLGDVSSIVRQTSTLLLDNSSNESTDIPEAVNLYEGKILLDNGNIYDVENDVVILNYVDNLTLVDDTKPLYEYNYEKTNIKTFGDYSIVDDKYITKRIVIRDGQVEILSDELLADSSSVLVGYYNGKNYLIYLDDDGVLHSVKEKIVYPNNFVNYGIKSIHFDKNDDSDNLIFVKYKNNDYVLFNYQTGEVLLEQKEYNPSLYEYVKDFFSNGNSNETNSISNFKYENAKSLIESIVEKSLDESTTSGVEIYENSTYTISYNPLSDTYEVYQIPNNYVGKSKLMDVLTNDSISKKISNSSELSKIYNYNMGDSYNWISSLIIILGILVLIIVATLILWRNIRKTS